MQERLVDMVIVIVTMSVNLSYRRVLNDVRMRVQIDLLL